MESFRLVKFIHKNPLKMWLPHTKFFIYIFNQTLTNKAIILKIWIGISPESDRTSSVRGPLKCYCITVAEDAMSEWERGWAIKEDYLLLYIVNKYDQTIINVIIFLTHNFNSITYEMSAVWCVNDDKNRLLRAFA